MFIDIIKVILLSIVEAFTEFLPVSSTGHMILLENFINLSVNKSFVQAFEIIIQLGAILAVVIIFFEKIYPFMYEGRKRKELLELWYKIILAVIPAVFLGLLFDDFINEKLFNPIIVAIMLIVYGIILIIIESINRKSKVNKMENITYKQALLIGIFQCLAMIPGTSRSASTIIGAMLIGLNRIIATEFSFFLAIPTMLGATTLKILKIAKFLTIYEISLIILGFILTFILSLVVIKFFLSYIKKHNFKIFGYYRIILGILILVYFLLVK